LERKEARRPNRGIPLTTGRKSRGGQVLLQKKKRKGPPFIGKKKGEKITTVPIKREKRGGGPRGKESSFENSQRK